LRYKLAIETRQNRLPIIDARLNTGIDDIKCLRIIDLVAFIKSGAIPGISRKQAKVLWAISDKNKNTFDNKIWPVEAKK